jgi:hypothetical protein
MGVWRFTSKEENTKFSVSNWNRLRQVKSKKQYYISPSEMRGLFHIIGISSSVSSAISSPLK